MPRRPRSGEEEDIVATEGEHDAVENTSSKHSHHKKSRSKEEQDEVTAGAPAAVEEEEDRIHKKRRTEKEDHIHASSRTSSTSEEDKRGSEKRKSRKDHESTRSHDGAHRSSTEGGVTTQKEEEEKGEHKMEESVSTMYSEVVSFSAFNISSTIVKALEKQNITSLFPVQAKTFEIIMKGKNILVQSRTGSGKTLAFGIPIVEHLLQQRMEGEGVPSSRGAGAGRGPAAVIFCPTRELAIQVTSVVGSIANGLTVGSLYGGVAYASQERMLRAGVDILVATPGRAKDMLEKGTLHFDRVSFVCLDEADHMLDIGFKDDIELLLRQVAEQNGSIGEGRTKHQFLLFSATVPDWVQTSTFIAKDTLEFVDMVGKDTVRAASTISFFRRKCHFSEFSPMLADLVKVYSGAHGKTIVFTNTKKDCHDLSINNTKLDSQCLHGDMQQEQRESTMKSFRENKFSVLIATDVAARGLDLPMVDLVIQCGPPSDMDAFIHRAGRTGRAGRKGVCVLLYSMKEEYVVERLERHAKIKFDILPAPTREEILKAVARDAAEDLARVEKRATDLFMDQAAELIKEADPVEILASALAVMSGYTTHISSRGLITGAKGFTTFAMRSQRPLPIPVICSILRQNFSDDLFSRCRDISLLQDEPGCVFDVPEMYAKEIMQISIPGMTLEQISVLPAIEARDLKRGRGGDGGGGYGGGRGRGGGGGGYGGGGYGGGRGRGGGGGGYGGGGYGGGRGRGGGGGGYGGGGYGGGRGRGGGYRSSSSHYRS